MDTDFLNHMPANLAVMFRDRVAQSGPKAAFLHPVAGPDGEEWKSITWAEAGEHVEKLAAGLLSMGLAPEERVGIASSTRYEWLLADLAVMCAGGATTTVYPTTGTDDVVYIVSDAECRVVFAEDAVQLEKLASNRADLPTLEKVVMIEAVPADADPDWVISLADLEALGAELLATKPDIVRTTSEAITSDQLATLIYTSGTTGRPKGVRLAHRAWVFQGSATKAQGMLGEEDLQFLWLPLAHSFGKTLMAIQMAIGMPTAVDGRVDKIVDNLAVVQPTWMGAAPRIFEKAHSRIVTTVQAEGGPKAMLFKRAFAVGVKYDQLQRAGKPIPLPMKIQYALFDKLVFTKIRARFGGKVRFFISGSAALNSDIAEWFNAAGIRILEGYGLTENAAGAAVGTLDDFKLGTVGKAFPGTEIKIGADDEVLLKGPHVMDGYHNLPEETAKALTDGWLHTGDKGSIDAEGFLTITGRIKDLFKTSGGKYIAPSAIEGKFKALCPYASQFLVFGAEKNFVSALIALDPEAMATWAAENGHEGTPYAELVASPEVAAMVKGYVEELNSGLNRWETIKRWEILDRDLSIESGELTPSLKVKRNVVEANQKERIESFYANS
ncbi:MAG: AMP-dependent synthetase/ligase [Nocardioides sp.]